MRLNEVFAKIGRPVAYYPQLAKSLGGVKSAIFACQFAYWAGKSDGDGIYKTQAAIEEETGLSKEEQMSAVKTLVRLGVLEVKKIGLPATNHYFFDWDALGKLIDSSPLVDGKPHHQSPEKPMSSGGESPRLEVGKAHDIYSTEITTEITTENKESASRSRPSKFDLLPNVEKQIAEDFLRLRKEKKLPVTKTAMDAIAREAEKVGLDFPSAIKFCCEVGWGGFNAEWYRKRLEPSPQAPPKNNSVNKPHVKPFPMRGARA